MVIQNLETYTEYRVWMTASTKVGEGPASEAIVGRTGEAGELNYVCSCVGIVEVLHY